MLQRSKQAKFLLKRRKVTFCVGLLGGLADSSVIARHGNTVVHAVITRERVQTVSDLSTVPLTIDYRDRSHAHGRIPVIPNRRDKNSTDDEVLAARVIDRSLRPLFPKGMMTESIQLMVTCHALDNHHDPVSLGINAASAALMLSSIPWNGPVGCCRVGYIDNKFVVNPDVLSLCRSASTSSSQNAVPARDEKSSLNLLYAGNSTGRAMMIDVEGQEINELIINEALSVAQNSIEGIINSQISLQNATTNADENDQGKNIKALITVDSDINDFLNNTDIMQEAFDLYNSSSRSKSERGQREGAFRSKLHQELVDRFSGREFSDVMITMALDKFLRCAFRKVLLENNGSKRNDGRTKDEVRNLDSFGDIFPSVHGSAIFKRGDTHILSVVALGSMSEGRTNPYPISGGLEINDRFILQYDFPPYCTGTVGNATSLNRRAVGHGSLAEKALRPVIPCTDDFPYTIRVSCECTSSNGSSAMASVVGASMALVDAGVPISSLVAGVSVGLITSEEESDNDSVLLVDITGTEDHYGDMDLKVAGSENGITAIQLDTKLTNGIPLVLLQEAILKAREGRQVILDHLKKQISIQSKDAKKSRDDKAPSVYHSNESHQLIPLISVEEASSGSVKQWVGGDGFGGKSNSKLGVKQQTPMSIVVHYNPEKKRYLLGPGGEMIHFIRKEYNCDINLEEDGKAYIFGSDAACVYEATSLVQDLVGGIKEGNVYNAQVVEVKDFGALVQLSRAQEAILHISEIGDDNEFANKSVADILTVGQNINVKVIHVDNSSGLVKVSCKGLYSHQTDHEVTTMKKQASFPTNSPRMWDNQYFKSSTAKLKTSSPKKSD